MLSGIRRYLDGKSETKRARDIERGEMIPLYDRSDEYRPTRVYSGCSITPATPTPLGVLLKCEGAKLPPPPLSVSTYTNPCGYVLEMTADRGTPEHPYRSNSVFLEPLHNTQYRGPPLAFIPVYKYDKGILHHGPCTRHELMEMVVPVNRDRAMSSTRDLLCHSETEACTTPSYSDDDLVYVPWEPDEYASSSAFAYYISTNTDYVDIDAIDIYDGYARIDYGILCAAVLDMIPSQTEWMVTCQRFGPRTEMEHASGASIALSFVPGHGVRQEHSGDTIARVRRYIAGSL